MAANHGAVPAMVLLNIRLIWIDVCALSAADGEGHHRKTCQDKRCFLSPFVRDGGARFAPSMKACNCLRKIFGHAQFATVLELEKVESHYIESGQALVEFAIKPARRLRKGLYWSYNSACLARAVACSTMACKFSA
jgi:hypothetical protein